tara:strand:+ start:932 stop:1168 length:237 start_codon:yes stop_codon:yes gene_type:complete
VNSRLDVCVSVSQQNLQVSDSAVSQSQTQLHPSSKAAVTQGHSGTNEVGKANNATNNHNMAELVIGWMCRKVMEAFPR